MTACFFGCYLLNKQLVTDAQLAQAIEVQSGRNLCIGELAVQDGLLTQTQVTSLNKDQCVCDMRLGEIALHKGWLSEADLQQLLQRQRLSNISIGEALIQTGALRSQQLSDLLTDYHFCRARSHDRCILRLRESGQAQLIKIFIDELVKALQRFCHFTAAMSHVSFDSPEQASVLNTQVCLQERTETDKNESDKKVFQFNLLCCEALQDRLATGFSGGALEVVGEAPVARELQHLLGVVSDSVVSRLKLREHLLFVKNCLTVTADDWLDRSNHLVLIDMAAECGEFQLLLQSR